MMGRPPDRLWTLLEAAETLLPAMYAGVPDLPIVTSLSQEGIDVRDGPATDRAVAAQLGAGHCG
jgi:hypothetical protein